MSQAMHEADAVASRAPTLKAGASAESTRQAQQDTVLTPRFYTTDFAAMDKLDVSSVRPEWDSLIAEMRSDPNKGHFLREGTFEAAMEAMDPPLRKEFLEFLVSSVTAEFSTRKSASA